MMLIASRYLLVVLTLMFSASWSVAQEGNRSVEQRLERLERLLDSQGLADILMRLTALEEEVRQLRGQNEEQMHALEDLKKRQRELYIDLDRRLLQLERGGSTSGEESSGTRSQQQSSVNATEKTPVKTAKISEPERPLEVTGAGKAAAPDYKDEREAYQEAFNLLRELEYDKAIEAFRGFLQDYPDGRYAHIARYWLGEANYAQRHFKEAISNYEALVASYPDSPKVAEAMLKIGYSHENLQDYKQARDILEKLIDKYPGTTEASQARNLLQKIRSRTSNR